MMIPKAPSSPLARRKAARLGTRPSQSGAALITVLAIVVFMALMVVALTVSMRMESQESRSYSAQSLAALMAWNGVENAKAALMTAATTTATTPGAWASGPGMVVYSKAGTPTAIPLTSTTATNGATNTVYAPPDLNRKSVTTDGLPVITGSRVPAPAVTNFYVGWVYVYQNGTTTAAQAPGLTAGNPIIGRYAYWVDDESSRISVNTPNTTSMGSNSWYGLSNLFYNVTNGTNATTAASLANFISTNGTKYPFNSVEEAGFLTNTTVYSTNFFNTNRFAMTASSFSPMLNPFGQPKIVLTTRSSSTTGTGVTNYLKILNSETADSGALTNISPTYLSSTLSNLNSCLSSNWPFFTKSFATKYSPYRINQLALDIVEYVRAAESTNAIVEPISGTWNGTSTFSTNNALTATNNNYFGTTRHPLLTQMLVTVNPTPSPPGPPFPATNYLTLYLPPNYGVTNLTLALPGNVTVQMSTAGFPVTTTFPIPAATTVTNSYAVVQVPMAFSNSIGSLPTTVNERVVFTDTNSAVWEVAPLDSTKYISVPTTNAATAIPTNVASITLATISDPRLNKFYLNWTTVASQKMQSFLTAPAPSATYKPPQDTVSGGATIDTANSLYMPKVAGTVANGFIHSVAELGHVSTGAESSTNTTSGGVPWRTLRLQPTPASSIVTNAPPDWALLDLFTAPLYTNTTPYAMSSILATNAIANKININSGLMTSNNAPNTNFTRYVPLYALLQASSNSATGILTNSTNIAKMTWSVSGATTNGTNYGVPNIYFSPGELAEVQGIADTGEGSETNLAGLIDRATTQSGAFRVYCIGQSLKQTPGASPTLVVTDEQYREVVVRSYSPYSTWTKAPSTLLWKVVPP